MAESYDDSTGVPTRPDDSPDVEFSQPSIDSQNQNYFYPELHAQPSLPMNSFNYLANDYHGYVQNNQLTAVEHFVRLSFISNKSSLRELMRAGFPHVHCGLFQCSFLY
jgi:hypothetical protein